MKIEKVVTEVGQTFSQMMEEATKLVADGANENVIVIVAKRDSSFHVLTDIDTPLTISLAMLKGAATAMFNAKKQQVQQTDGAPEIIES